MTDKEIFIKLMDYNKENNSFIKDEKVYVVFGIKTPASDELILRILPYEDLVTKYFSLTDADLSLIDIDKSLMPIIFISDLNHKINL